MDYNFIWLSRIGLDIEAGIGYAGGQDKYVAALQRFYKAYEKNRSKIEGVYAKGNWEEYKIVVHALKSNSKMIGAMQISEAFEILEKAADKNDGATVDKYHVATLTAYRQLVERLEPISRIEEVHPVGEIGGDEARGTADRLLEALDDFDDESAKELAVKLSGYPFRLHQKEILAEAIDQIDNFLYDEAAELIRKLYPTIE